MEAFMELKELYSPTFIQRLGAAVQREFPAVHPDQLLSDCLAGDWSELKLMERRERIVTSLHRQLPADFEQAAPILRAIAPQFTGLAAVCLPHYVARYGLAHWSTAMSLLEELIRYSSSEFAIRPFLVRYPQATEAQMLRWAHDRDAAVRRLASEGLRPRLPWGSRLAQYVTDPTPIWPVLRVLMTDESEYVQKSVANNLNDISKDHPQAVIDWAQTYWDRTPQTTWILTRGLRTLFKQGNPTALALQGYALTAADHLTACSLTPVHQAAGLGTATTLQYAVTADTEQPLSVYLGYRVHYVRQRQAPTTKDFYLKRTTIQPGETVWGQLTRPWRQLTTRKLYSGDHVIELLVNTRVVATAHVQLAVGDSN
ncbi:DNA alkylation repair enzyme [Levilactobacillus acidifarinae DSM 19394]|uniref:DNA alkylation repair enzyme n=2 Tax=Levilactobacillus acidifarinae TaxID=267364 RepID=A0A0R1LFW1_9LACO|nr:DNA alkylation repair enzyme [Levilactobacillus acidifarinae DSM 19394]